MINGSHEEMNFKNRNSSVVRTLKRPKIALEAYTKQKSENSLNTPSKKRYISEIQTENIQKINYDIKNEVDPRISWNDELIKNSLISFAIIAKENKKEVPVIIKEVEKIIYLEKEKIENIFSKTEDFSILNQDKKIDGIVTPAVKKVTTKVVKVSVKKIGGKELSERRQKEYKKSTQFILMFVKQYTINKNNVVKSFFKKWSNKTFNINYNQNNQQVSYLSAKLTYKIYKSIMNKSLKYYFNKWLANSQN